MTRTLTMTAVALSLLAAGAVAVIAAVPESAGRTSENVTTISKNQAWPAKGLITMTPCAVSACQEV